jgi:hypothetical protein
MYGFALLPAQHRHGGKGQDILSHKLVLHFERI